MLVYVGTNAANGKRYIGITTRPTIAKRLNEHRSRAMAGSKTALACAIRKYGWAAFSWKIIATCDNPAELTRLEIEWIERMQSHVDTGLGYNRTLGGDGAVGCRVSAETREKLSIAGTGRRWNAEQLKAMSERNKGVRPSLACMEAGRRARSTPEFAAKISAARKGKGFRSPPSAIAAMVNARKKRHEKQLDRKLRNEELSSITERRRRGESFARIGRDYGVTPSCVFYFCKRLAA